MKTEASKNQVSALEKERIGILAAINMTRREISENQFKIDELQKKIEQSKKDREYWNKVWWATCWIPFANIGTVSFKGTGKIWNTKREEAAELIM